MNWTCVDLLDDGLDYGCVTVLGFTLKEGDVQRGLPDYSEAQSLNAMEAVAQGQLGLRSERTLFLLAKRLLPVFSHLNLPYTMPNTLLPSSNPISVSISAINSALFRRSLSGTLSYSTQLSLLEASAVLNSETAYWTSRRTHSASLIGLSRPTQRIGWADFPLNFTA